MTNFPQFTKAVNYRADDVSRAIGDNMVSMSNALTRAGHGLSLAEKRLVFCAISRIDSRPSHSPEQGLMPTSRVTAEEYAEIAQCGMSSAYEALKAAAGALYERSITFYVEAHNRKGQPPKLTARQMRWVGSATYRENEGCVELAWWPPVLPHLTGLRKEFTAYRLSQATGLRSAASWKMLELLTRFEKTCWAQYTIEDFSIAMDATELQSENFARLRTQLIEPALKELDEKAGWKVQYRTIKAGRRVAALRFDFLTPEAQKKAEKGKKAEQPGQLGAGV